MGKYKEGHLKITRLLKNYLWVDSIHNYKCCETCDQCCEKKKVGGLGLVDPMEVTKVLPFKMGVTCF
jgi:hypothetical protein